MTCAHVLGLIDAGPVADYPPAHLEAAWVHARQCDTCGRALGAATALTAELSALPQIAPLRDLAGAVLARIAVVDQVHAARATTSMRTDSVKRDWPTWVTVVAGFAAASAIAASISPGDAVPSEIAFSMVGGMSTRPMPSTTSGLLAMAAGLFLYAAVLFAPIAARSAPQQ
jgi:hypothetical protein